MITEPSNIFADYHRSPFFGSGGKFCSNDSAGPFSIFGERPPSHGAIWAPLIPPSNSPAKVSDYYKEQRARMARRETASHGLQYHIHSDVQIDFQRALTAHLTTVWKVLGNTFGVDLFKEFPFAIEPVGLVSLKGLDVSYIDKRKGDPLLGEYVEKARLLQTESTSRLFEAPAAIPTPPSTTTYKIIPYPPVVISNLPSTLAVQTQPT
ncbi:hypothetical protein HJFPF1_06795 [Paramyrothecium foliicola]|nr:hypothetical protein HJFPF1_06795 [Paramyrothecium foliicola]